MSVLEGSNNNSNRVSPPHIQPNDLLVQPYSRDPKYSYPDGNIVFLVDKVLFKVRLEFINAL